MSSSPVLACPLAVLSACSYAGWGWGRGGVDVRGLCTGCGVVSSGVGVRRGLVGAVPFTQVSNALFRDGRISFKAKGLFGLIASHRSGWRVSVAALAGCGREGRDAVRAGLGELEYFGYLRRERVRQADGTLGPVVYVITDQPAGDGGGSPGEVGSAALPPPSSPASPHAGSASLPADHKPNPAPTDAPQVGSALSLRSSAVTASSVSSRSGRCRPGCRLGRPRCSCRLGNRGSWRIGLCWMLLRWISQRRIFRRWLIQRWPARGVRTSVTRRRKQGREEGPPFPPAPPDQNGHRSRQPRADGPPPRHRTVLRRAGARRTVAWCGVARGAVAGADRCRQPTAMPDRDGSSCRGGSGGSSAAAGLQRAAGGTCHRRAAVTPTSAHQRGGRHRRTDPRPGHTARRHHCPPGVSRLGARCPDAARDSPPESSVPQHPLHRPAPPPAVNTLSAPVSHVMVECGGCGRPGTVTGTRLCPLCLDWPACRSCTGPTPRRADPSGHGQCSACTQSSSHPAVQSGFGP